MPDLGRPIRLGTFVTPANRPPDQAVRLAQQSERAGLDLVTFQDHPYQPRFHDTWTLLSWVAARTERIHVSGNVLNLPLRQPAVLARSAASLDLLSGGRVALGVGAGGFWDAIEAMGGRRLTAGQGVEALEEAIEIIRGIWAEGDRRPLRVAGDWYAVDGAKRGPLPAHDIPIWIGAYKPRMLRLTGTVGDGWLPSLGYMQPGDLADANRRIDDAAEAAGRAPAEVERLLNVGMGDWSLDGEVERMLQLALEDGVSTFVVATDDAARIAQLGAEVAPALREAVARERARRGTSMERVRPAIALAARRAGIDYAAVPASLAASAVEPGDFDYAHARSTYMRGGAPGLVLRPSTVDEVVEALAFARAQDVPMSVRSGGHGISGRSTNDGGIVVDVGAIDHVEVLDTTARLVRMGPGARWMDVATALAPHGWALSSGDYGGVGVGGLATAGGVGWLVREHGLTIDHVRAATIVLADGSVVRASAEERPDLLWAIRGAGANMGIVVDFEMEVDEVGDVGFAQLAVATDDRAAFLERWGAAVEAAPRDTTSFVILGQPRPAQPDVAQIMVAVDADDPHVVEQRLQLFVELGTLVGADARMTTYAGVMANASGEPHQAAGEPLARSGLLRSITPEFAAAASDLLARGLVPFFQIRAMGGAVADVPADATAFAHRDAGFSVVAIGRDAARLDPAWDALEHHFSGLYLSFETDLRDERIGRAFPPATLARLQAAKRRYDPENVFRDNFNVAPGPAEG